MEAAPNSPKKRSRPSFLPQKTMALQLLRMRMEQKESKEPFEAEFLQSNMEPSWMMNASNYLRNMEPGTCQQLQQVDLLPTPQRFLAITLPSLFRRLFQLVHSCSRLLLKRTKPESGSHSALMPVFMHMEK